jgi:5-methylcytosine-specific restriction endonuclease McrA
MLELRQPDPSPRPPDPQPVPAPTPSPQPTPPAPEPRVARARPSGQGRLRNCAHCGNTYRPKRSRQKTFCSVECRNDAMRATKVSRRVNYNSPSRVSGKNPRRRARKYGVEYQPVSKRTVFERDNWTCGICSKPIDQALSYPHQLSASLDHVVPLSRGGAHTYSNVRAAHLICNSLRGAGW